MPWNTECRSGPTCFAQAVGGGCSDWSVEIYVPVERKDLEKRIGDITARLREGEVLAAAGEIDSLADHVQGETQLAQGIARARKNIETLVNSAKALETAAKDAGDGDEVAAISGRVRAKLASNAAAEIERLEKVPVVYFELKDKIYSFLTAVSRRESEERTEATLQEAPESFRKEPLERYRKFRAAEKGALLEQSYPNFLRLIECCADVIGSYIGDEPALNNEEKRTAAAFQTLMIPVKLKIMKHKEQCGYISRLYDDKYPDPVRIDLEPAAGRGFYDRESAHLHISVRDIFCYSFIPQGDESIHILHKGYAIERNRTAPISRSRRYGY